MILPYVYKLTHKDNNQYYFGYRSRNVILGLASSDDLGIKYFTSSHSIKRDFSKYDFEIVAEFFKSEDAYDVEQELIREHWGNPLLLNKHYHAADKTRWKNTGHSNETRQKMSITRTGYKTGKPAWNTGKTEDTDESLKKMSNSLLGNIPWNKSISADDPRSQSGEKNGFFGKTHNIETKAHLSEVAKNRPKYECCHCGKFNTITNHNRWHNDNCKKK